MNNKIIEDIFYKIKNCNRLVMWQWNMKSCNSVFENLYNNYIFTNHSWYGFNSKPILKLKYYICSLIKFDFYKE